MTCTEFQEILPDIIEGEATVGEHAVHLQSCPVCSDLVADLKAICDDAKLLQAVEEPSPRVWANIHRTLEWEGLVRTPRQAGGVLIPAKSHWLRSAWLLPLTGVVLLAVGLLLYNSFQRNSIQVAQAPSGNPQPTVTAPNSAGSPASDSDDQQLLAEVAPSMRATYEVNLKDVNSFIRDAEQVVAQNPNDDEARQWLMDAYQQKAVVYDLAMTRSMQ